MTPRSTKPCKDTTKELTEMSKKPFDSSTDIMLPPRLHWWSKCHYNKLFPQVTHHLHLDSMVYTKIHKAIALCNHISACGTATYLLAKFLTKFCKSTQVLPTCLSKTVKFQSISKVSTH